MSKIYNSVNLWNVKKNQQTMDTICFVQSPEVETKSSKLISAKAGGFFQTGLDPIRCRIYWLPTIFKSFTQTLFLLLCEMQNQPSGKCPRAKIFYMTYNSKWLNIQQKIAIALHLK